MEKSKAVDSFHEQFIFLWIAFNAAYGAEDIGVDADGERVKEVDRYRNFLREILRRDEQGKIQKIIWDTYSGPIRVLLKNKYVFRNYWDFVRGVRSEKEWKLTFRTYNRRVDRALGKNDVRSVLTILIEILYRLYTLRNQIFHGGTTFGTGWGQEQLRDGSRIMASLVPIILTIMDDDIKKNPHTKIWGKVAYPRINPTPDENVA